MTLGARRNRTETLWKKERKESKQRFTQSLTFLCSFPPNLCILLHESETDASSPCPLSLAPTSSVVTTPSSSQTRPGGH